MYGTLYRNLLLPAFEKRLKGRKTLDYWAAAEQSQWWSRAALEEHQLRSLRNLLVHAYETCPYYRRQWNAAGLDPYRLESLEDYNRWPLLTRDELTRHRDEIRSTQPYLRFRKSTGGSTGQPLHFELDTGSHERRVGMTYRGYGWAGGGPGSKQLHIWSTSLGRVTRLQLIKQSLHRGFNNQRLISAFDFTPEMMPKNLQTLNRYRPDVIVAYTNALYEFARYLSENRLVPYSPNSIIVGAERILGFQRELIESVFRAPVFETYGSREFMLMGAECERHSGLHLSMENLLLEVAGADGSRAVAGKEGDVVVTDLFNYAMPFIRYVNGDRAVAGFEMCACGRGLPLLSQVSGRKVDVLHTPDGRRVPGEFFPHLMKEYRGVRRFQVHQSSLERIELKLVVDDSFTAAERALLFGEILNCVGTEVEIDLKIVDDIPLTAAGKHRVVVRSADLVGRSR